MTEARRSDPTGPNTLAFTILSVMSIPFTPVFGDAPHARVLDYLLDHKKADHTITEIARGASVARPTVYKVVDDLLGLGVIHETRVVGNSRFFALNARSRAVRELARVSPVLAPRNGRLA
ncbi:MAG TPA: winged helix-turn-helix domain-containing protein [Candidatus Thermoplasmatota archaeon]|nr:winged helix-turn-helix domain-containing protein [Candidatus Thermoplasmatota archaeon]